jgi:hypothetical protein
MGDLSFLPTAREIAAASVGYLKPAEVTPLPRRPGADFWTTPRGRFLGAVTRLDHAGCEAAAAARRIYCRSLADDIDLPDPSAIAACIRLLAGIDEDDAATALLALADMLSPVGGEAA